MLHYTPAALLGVAAALALTSGSISPRTACGCRHTALARTHAQRSLLPHPAPARPPPQTVLMGSAL